MFFINFTMKELKRVDVIRNLTNKKHGLKIDIPVDNILIMMIFPQHIAANLLGVSLSTLKRRYYQLNNGRRPNYKDKKSLVQIDEILSCRLKERDKLKVEDVVSKYNIDEKTIDNRTSKIISLAFKKHLVD
jgi:hypothetical protein